MSVCPASMGTVIRVITRSCEYQVNTSIDAVGSEPPPRASLQDNYMLTNSKLRDWDNMQVTLCLLSSECIQFPCRPFLVPDTNILY